MASLMIQQALNNLAFAGSAKREAAKAFDLKGSSAWFGWGSEGGFMKRAPGFWAGEAVWRRAE